jgi:hypothetical protein
VEPLAKAFCRVHELHYQTKARKDGLHENFDCYNFAYRKDMKTPVVSYRTKWPTGWKTEWFYVKIDEKKEKLVQSPLELTFGLTRPQCNMTPGTSCLDVVCEFRVVSEHIGTRDLVQEYLANRVFPTLKEWGMPKLKGEKKKNELVRLPYHFKFKKHFKEPCQEWLDTFEVMCNEIVGTCFLVQGDPTGVCSDVNWVLARDGKSSVNLASQGHCAGVFIGISVPSVQC